MKEKYRNCPICGNEDYHLYAKATSNIPFSPKQILVTEKHFGLHGNMITCIKCGFAYIGDTSYVAKITGLYEDMNDEANIQEEKERRKSFIRILDTIERTKNKKRKNIGYWLLYRRITFRSKKKRLEGIWC